MTLSDGDLSRAVSHALRHEPWLYEIEVDEEVGTWPGWKDGPCRTRSRLTFRATDKPWQ